LGGIEKPLFCEIINSLTFACNVKRVEIILSTTKSLKIIVNKFVCSGIVFLILSNQLARAQSLNEITPQVEKWNRDAQYDSSVFILKKALKLKANEADRGTLYLKLGKTYNSNDQLLEAFQNYRKAEIVFNKKNDIEGKAKVYVAFIEFNRKKQKYDDCWYYFSRLETFIKKQQISQRTMAAYYGRRAAVEQEKNKDSKVTRKYANKVIEIAKKLNDNELLGEAYNEIAGTYEQEENYEFAVNYLKKALEYWRKTENYLYITYELTCLGRNEAKRKQYTASKNYLKQGIVYAEKYNLNSQKIYLYSILRDIYALEKAFESAYEMQIKYDNVRYVVENENSEKILKELEEKYQLEKQINISNIARQRAKKSDEEVVAKRNQSKILILFSLVLLLLIVVITFLAIRLKRKNKQLHSTNSDLNLALDQKDILFKELHHRVKNNLTILKSILFLQAKSALNPEVKHALTDSTNRIESMSLVHENLYDAADVTRVELKGFIQQLLFKIEYSIFPQDKKMNIEIDEKKISMPISTAIFIGFVLNELVTNSMKYAIQMDQKLKIGVKFTEIENHPTNYE
jgi:two-component sensor histidine kinase